VDGNLDTFSHNDYFSDFNKIDPWWQVDLEAEYCLSKITIVNRQDEHLGPRLAGAVVRAGLNSSHTMNTMVGSPITSSQVDVETRLIDFNLDPPVIARYVSVDIPGVGKLLHMGEVIVEEAIDEVGLASKAIPLEGSASTQSSTHYPSLGSIWQASNAVSESLLISDEYCTLTEEQQNPWWKVDLLTDQCVKKIIVKSRNLAQTYQRTRFEDVVVRAGLNTVITNNTMCGSPVTKYQAIANNWMEFACHSPDGIIARYVSVDVQKTAKLSVCKILVIPCDLPEEDYCVVTNPALIPSSNDAVISVNKGPQEISANVAFGRQPSTGGTNSGLPPESYQEVDQSSQCQTRRLHLPAESGTARTGVFYFEAITFDRSVRIQTVLLQEEGSGVQVRPLQRTQTANLGESVTLEMQSVNPSDSEYRWRRDGGEIIISWTNQPRPSIDDVTVEDKGVYTCFIDNYENPERVGITRLIVRECPADKWGRPECLKACPRCHNGVICDDKNGRCICGPGFSGKHCHHRKSLHMVQVTHEVQEGVGWRSGSLLALHQ
jgi:hypothetical protein